MASSTVLIFTRSHPRVNWARGPQCRVPSTIVAELSKLKTLSHAQAFVRSAGIETIGQGSGSSATAHGVRVMPPDALDLLDKANVHFHSPQVVLPTIGCGTVPFGTVLINCLLPKIEEEARALALFGRFQYLVNRLSERLAANPFACITGFKTREDGKHELYYRGFRFFYSSRPNILYKRIELQLRNWISFRLGADEKGNPDRRKQIEGIRSCLVGGRMIEHSILDDATPEDADTVLVDLRP